nr:MAG TPA: hypothetical protein [Caudoviricetes sp.]
MRPVGAAAQGFHNVKCHTAAPTFFSDIIPT